MHILLIQQPSDINIKGSKHNSQLTHNLIISVKTVSRPSQYEI